MEGPERGKESEKQKALSHPPAGSGTEPGALVGLLGRDWRGCARESRRNCARSLSFRRKRDGDGDSHSETEATFCDPAAGGQQLRLFPRERGFRRHLRAARRDSSGPLTAGHSQRRATSVYISILSARPARIAATRPTGRPCCGPLGQTCSQWPVSLFASLLPE